MPSLSATIISYNEAANITRAIRSLRCADEVVVVDSGSSDKTCEIASSLGARIFVQPWQGFASQKNFATDLARHDWILSLDADEELDARAQVAVEEWKTSSPGSSGYRFARRAFYLGRWIRHSGWYPDFKLRLYDRRQGQWEGDYVHESVAVRGPVETLPGEILHFTCNSLEEHRQRLEFYTDLAAAEILSHGDRPPWIRRHTAPAWTFALSYIFRWGFLDGVPGFWIAYMASHYVATKYAKWARLSQEKHG